jgi:hypothetical protein
MAATRDTETSRVLYARGRGGKWQRPVVANQGGGVPSGYALRLLALFADQQSGRQCTRYHYRG